MENLSPIQMDIVRIALQFHAALIAQTLQMLQLPVIPPVPEQKPDDAPIK